MKINSVIALFLMTLMMASCGGEPEKKEKFSYDQPKTTTKKESTETSAVKASERIDLESKGIGPVTSLTLPSEIDQAMAEEGKQLFNPLCLACHKADKRFIGPSPKGIMERRTPEWIMNMILNPQEMLMKDPLAKDLLIEFNGSPMANQSLTEEQARAIVEYFRTL